MIYEHRTYTCTPGSKEQLRQRFKDHAFHLFAKHGINVVDFWENPSHPAGEFIYICQFESEDAMQQAWNRFSNDPVWISVKAKTEQNGPLIQRIESKTLIHLNERPSI